MLAQADQRPAHFPAGCGSLLIGRRRIITVEDPPGRLAVPNERMADDKQIVPKTEFDIIVGGPPVIAIGALFGMDQHHFRSFSGEIWLN